MKTRGTSNLHLLTDAELRSMLGSTALEVYEAHVFFGEDEIDFAIGTFEKFAAERKRRTSDDPSSRLHTPDNLRDQKTGFLG